MRNILKLGTSLLAGLVAQFGQTEQVEVYATYDVECFDACGNLKWTESFRNTVVTAGKNDILDKYFKGSSYSATWFVGLIQSDNYSAIAAGDTMASHAGWEECTSYDESVRQTLTLGTVASGSVNNSASKAVFTISATKTVKGAFLVTNSTKGGTTGTLYSAGLFSGGDRAVVDNDVLNVTVTLTAA
jgi:hypothetical protein